MALAATKESSGEGAAQFFFLKGFAMQRPLQNP